MFVSQTQAPIMPIKMQLQTAKKGSMNMSAYFAKMKRLANPLAIAYWKKLKLEFTCNFSHNN